MIINEVAWAGTAANTADEWVELYNAGTTSADITGWSLCEGSTQIVPLINSIAVGGYYLIERGADDAALDIVADLAHAFGGSGLSNGGEHLTLRAGGCADGEIMDEVGPGAWYAGSAGPDYASMERIDPNAPGTGPSNWASNDGVTVVGADAAGNPVRGTPAYRNSVAI